MSLHRESEHLAVPGLPFTGLISGYQQDSVPPGIEDIQDAVVPQAGQLSQPDAGRLEHRDDRGVAALGEAAARTGMFQPGQLLAGKTGTSLSVTCGGCRDTVSANGEHSRPWDGILTARKRRCDGGLGEAAVNQRTIWLGASIACGLLAILFASIFLVPRRSRPRKWCMG